MLGVIMPVLNLSGDNLPGVTALRAALAPLPPTAPVVLMVHGFRYDPARPETDPARLIFAPPGAASRAGRTISWPRHLRLSTEDGGLGIGFGRPARGDIWSAYGRAEWAALRFAELVEQLRIAAPGRPLHAITHSLGARVVLSALRHQSGPGLDSAILLSGAEFAAEARASLDAARHLPEVLNVNSRENFAFDAALRLAFPTRGRTIGAGLSGAARWTDIALHDLEEGRPLGAHGLGLRGQPRTICHWSGYLRPGAFRLYRALLAGDLRPADLTRGDMLGADLIPAAQPSAAIGGPELLARRPAT